MIISNLIGFLWLIFLVYWWVSATKSKAYARRQDRWRGAGFRLVIILIILLFLQIRSVRIFFEHYTLIMASSFGSALGFILVLLGMGLAVWARINLGRNWGMPMSRKVDPELVTSGPYRFVRHPIYSGVLLAILGSALADNAFWLIGFFVLGIYFVWSAKVEERIMTEQFPDQYLEYKKKTKMLIPFIF